MKIQKKNKFKINLLVGGSNLWVMENKDLLSNKLLLISKKNFFNQIRLNFFSNNCNYIANDDVLEIIAANFFAKNNNCLFGESKQYSNLIKQIYQSNITPKEIFYKLKNKFNFNKLFFDLYCIDNLVMSTNRIAKIQSLYLSNKYLFELKYKNIEFRDIVIFTELELNIIKNIASLGVNINLNFSNHLYGSVTNDFFNFLKNFFKKFANIKINFYEDIKSKIGLKLLLEISLEKQDLSNIHLCQELTLQKEAEWVVGSIVSLLEKKKNQKVAIIVEDNAFSIEIKKALNNYDLAWKHSKENSLKDTMLGNLLLSVIKLLIDNISLKWLFHIIGHPSLNASIKDEAFFCIVMKILKNTGLKSDYEYANQGYGALNRKLKLLLLYSKVKQEKEEIKLVANKIEEIISIVKVFPKYDNLYSYIKISKYFIENNTVDNEESGQKDFILEKFDSWLVVFENLDSSTYATISIIQYKKWIEDKFNNIFIPANSSKSIKKIELLNFQEVVGRKFDILAVTNLVHNSLQIDFKINRLIDDDMKILINKLFKKTIFHFLDTKKNKTIDFFLNALESVKFLSVCNSCTSDLLLSRSVFDSNGIEKIANKYFRSSFKALNYNLGVKKIIISKLIISENLFVKKIQTIKNLNLPDLTGMINAYDLLKEIVEKNNIIDRKYCNKFIFYLPDNYLKKKYFQKLGFSSKHAIAPTMIENIARCKFKAFAENFIGINSNNITNIDLNIKDLGSLAHKVLEIFFNERIKNNVHYTRFDKLDQIRLISIFKKYSKRLLNKLIYSYKLVAKIKLQWLCTSILNMLSLSIKNPPILNARPKKCEFVVGINSKKLSLTSVPLLIGEDLLYFGGIVDRIDESKDEIVVVDYKMASGSAIKSALSEKNILKYHFQIPVYLLLIKKHLLTCKMKKLGGYFISIKDGLATPVLGINKMTELNNILEESSLNTLKLCLKKTIKPFLEGIIIPNPGDACINCNLSIVCRVSHV